MNPLLDLELLHTFVEIVQTGELKKAAHNIHRSHGAVSMQMKRLEEQLGCSLMTRSNRGIQLTTAGKTLLSYSEQLLKLNHSTVSALTTKAFNSKLRFGIPTDYAHGFLNYFLPLLTQELPHLDATIHCDRSRNLRKQLAKGELDIIIVAGEVEESDELLLWSERLIWSAPAHVQLEQLSIIPVAILQDDCIVRDLCLAALNTAKLAYHCVFTSPVLENVATAVHSGFAISLLPESLIDEDRSRMLSANLLRSDFTLNMNMIYAAAIDDSLLTRISKCMRQAAKSQQLSR